MGTFAQPSQSPLDEQDSRFTPQAAKKKKKGKIIAVDAGLEGFLNLVDPNSRDRVEEREDDISSLAFGFTVRMRKQVASAQGETTPSSKVSSEKCPKRFGRDEEAQKSLAVINVDSPERVLNALLTLECAS